MYEHVLYSTITLIALTAPLGELALFLSVMHGRSARDVRRAAAKVAVGAYVVLVVTLLAGTRILDVFGVSFAAFRAAGGLVLAVIGLQMLQGHASPFLLDAQSRSDPEDHLWVPLVMPLIAGPASMITVISLAARETAGSAEFAFGTMIAVTAATAVVFLLLLFAIPVQRAVRPRVARLFERFFGLILVAIGFQMGLTGIREFFFGG
jgi:multiple antibiotic resistance protein